MDTGEEAWDIDEHNSMELDGSRKTPPRPLHRNGIASGAATVLWASPREGNAAVSSPSPPLSPR